MPSKFESLIDAVAIRQAQPTPPGGLSRSGTRASAPQTAEGETLRPKARPTRPVLSPALVERYASKVHQIARKLARQVPSSILEGDLAGYGWLGLMEALGRAPPDLPAEALEARCCARIRGAMLDHLRSLDPAGRATRRESRRIAHAISNLSHRLRRAPAEEEIAAELGVDLAAYQRTLEAVAAAGMARLAPLDLDALEHASDDEPEEVVSDRERRGLLANAITRLPPRHRHVLALRYQDGCTLREVGEVLGVTESRACQLHAEAMHRLRADLGAA